MSTIALFEGKNLPATTRGSMDPDTNALAGGGGGMRRISIKGGVFREMLSGKEYRASDERAINVTVVRVAPHNSRQYFPGTYVEGEKVSPVCWSSDGQKPDEESREKQSPNCASCPQNIKGSGQGESRACRFQRRLAVMLEGGIGNREVYQLIAPATSVFGDGEPGKMPLQKYAQHLKAHNQPITGIITEVRFDTASTQPKLIFSAVRPLTAEEQAVVTELRDSPEAVAAVTMNVAQTDGIAPPPPHKTPLFGKADVVAPKQLPQAAVKTDSVKEVVEPEVGEPKKVSAKRPLVAPKLEDLVSEWDD